MALRQNLTKNFQKNLLNPLAFHAYAWYNKGTVEVNLGEYGGKARKENIMDEPMTDFQFKALLKMVLEILKSSGSIEEAIAKVEALVDESK